MPRVLRPVVAFAVLVLLAAACGGDNSSGEAATDDTTAEGTDYAAVAAEAEWEEHVPGGDCQCADGSQVTSGSAGVFDAANEANPFRGYSFVFVPYCTGDIHLGDAAHDYGGGLTVNHVGYVNASAGF